MSNTSVHTYKYMYVKAIGGEREGVLRSMGRRKREEEKNKITIFSISRIRKDMS